MLLETDLCLVALTLTYSKALQPNVVYGHDLKITTKNKEETLADACLLDGEYQLGYE